MPMPGRTRPRRPDDHAREPRCRSRVRCRVDARRGRAHARATLTPGPRVPGGRGRDHGRAEDHRDGGRRRHPGRRIPPRAGDRARASAYVEMTRPARTATGAELDLRIFFELVDRSRALSSPEECGCLDLGKQVILDMVRLLHQRSTTLARLRRLFGIRTTEKLRAVFPARARPPTTRLRRRPPTV